MQQKNNATTSTWDQLLCCAHIKLNERHGIGTAKSIGGYYGGRSSQPMASIKKHCKEPSRSPSSWVAKCPWHHEWTP